MAIDDERRKVLEMIESGKVSAAEDLHLQDGLMDMDTEDKSETEASEPVQVSTSNNATINNPHKRIRIYGYRC